MDAPNALSSIKSILNQAVPQLLARLPKLTTVGDVYSVEVDPSIGLLFKKLENEQLNTFNNISALPFIDKLSLDMFSKVCQNVFCTFT